MSWSGTSFVGVQSIVSCPGPYLCPSLAPGRWSAIASGLVSSKIRRIRSLLYPESEIWTAVLTAIGSGIAAHPSPLVHVGHGVNVKMTEKTTEMRSVRRRKGSDWRMTFVSGSPCYDLQGAASWRERCQTEERLFVSLLQLPRRCLRSS